MIVRGYADNVEQSGANDNPRPLLLPLTNVIRIIGHSYSALVIGHANIRNYTKLFACFDYFVKRVAVD